MSVRLQFVCERAVTSRLIAWFGAGHFSHVDAVLPDGQLLGARSDAAGGKPPGVHARPAGYHRFARRTVMQVPATEQQTARFYEYLQQQLGKPYDHKAIWGFILDRNWRDERAWICSELQAVAGEVSGILPQLFTAASKITPGACALAFSAVGGRILEQD